MKTNSPPNHFGEEEFPEPTDDSRAPREVADVVDVEVEINRLQTLREGSGIRRAPRNKPYRLEVHDPRISNEWKILREIAEDEIEAVEQLRNELNRTNAPVLIRIVHTTKF